MLLLQRASAGSGKTYTLARSFIGMLISIRDEDGKTRLRRPDEIEDAASHILAITFTNKATAEMKSRIIEKLTDLAGRSADAEKTDYLQHFIEKLGVAEAKIREACRLALNALLNNYSDFQISTIDSFFQTVLRTFAYEADLNDSYQVELDNAFLIDSGIDLTVRSLSEGNADPETVYWIGRLMRDAADAGSHWNMFAAGSGSRSGSLRKRLKEIVGEMEKEDFKRMKREFDGYFDRTEDYSAVIAEYAEHIEKPLREAHRQAVEAANEAAKAFSRHGLDLKANGANNLASHVQKTIGSSDIFCPVDFKYTTLQTKLADKDEACLSSKFKKHGLSTAVLGELADSVRSLYAAIDNWKALASTDEALLWRLYMPTLPFPALMYRIRENVKGFLRDNNLLELSDTNTMLSKVIGDDDAPFIYERIGSRLDHYLIDEFQDTSALQWDNIRPLLRESVSRSLDNLIIGDAKQSIYRFRNADPSLITSKVPKEFRRMPFGTAGTEKAENTNHRSMRRIVEFNNTLFTLASAHLDMAGRELGMNSQEHSLAALYSNVVQYPRKGETEDSGYVEMNFIDPDADQPDPDGSVDRFAHVGPLIDRLVDRGYRMADIAVLVERNSQGADIISHLIAYNSRPDARRSIDFISDESLKIGISRAVRIIVAALEMVSVASLPDAEESGEPPMPESGAEAMFSLFIATHQELDPDRQIEEFFKDPAGIGKFAGIISGMPSVTLPALVEAVIGEMVPAGLKKTDAAFIAAFQDCVIDYCRNYPADVASFVDWWKTKGSRLSINSPEGADAVRVMTIHKSKGLEFKCVILPDFSPSFGKTSKTGNSHDSYLWLKPMLRLTGGPALPPLLPVKIDHRLMPASPLREAFTENLYGETMDALNTAYVACTRAAEELYIFTKLTKAKKNSKTPLPDTLPTDCRELCRMLYYFFSPDRNAAASYAVEEIKADESGAWLAREELFRSDNVGPGDSLRITYGDPVADPAARRENERGKTEQSSEKTATRVVVAEKYASSPLLTRLGYKSRLTFADEEETDGARRADGRSFGNLFHDILADVETASDLERAVRKRAVSGEITPEEARKATGMLAAAMASVESYGWFSGEWRVVNERPIIAAGATKRPDRVMISRDGRRAVVVDYKTGALDDDAYRKKRVSHCRQVEEYMRLLQKALRLESTEGYVWYISRGEVVPAKSRQ